MPTMLLIIKIIIFFQLKQKSFYRHENAFKLKLHFFHFYDKLSGKKDKFGKVFVYSCSGKSSASKMNKKKISFNGLKTTILALYLHIEKQFTNSLALKINCYD